MRGKICIVTGAGQGIGRAIALEFAARSVHRGSLTMYLTTGPARWLPVGAARPELDPGQDGDGRHQQPGGEQQVHGEAEDG